MRRGQSGWRVLLGQFHPVDWLVDSLLGHDVFISYSREDGSGYARRLEGKLADSGYRCFFDDYQLEPGSPLNLRLSIALRRTSALVVVVTRGALASPHVQREIQIFSGLQRHIVPLFLDPSLRTSVTGGKVEELKQRVWLDDPAGALAGEPTQQAIGRLATTFRFVRRSRQRMMAMVASALFLTALVAFAFQQLYRVETARRLSEAQVLARTQPTEALLMLAETRDRWFNDRSLLPQLSEGLLAAAPTRRRHDLSDSVGGVLWLPDGGYGAASADGHGYIWDKAGKPLPGLQARGVVTADEGSAFESEHVPVSKLLLAGDHIGAVDWRGCLRLFPRAGIAPPDVNPANSCINRREGEETGSPFAISPDGKVAYVDRGEIRVEGLPDIRFMLPERGGATVELIVYESDSRLHIRYSDGSLFSLHPSGKPWRISDDSTQMGQCGDGGVWWVNPTGGFFRSPAGTLQPTETKLSGKTPFAISPKCTLYVDGQGDLYRLSSPSAPVMAGMAVGWQYGGNGVKVQFSPADTRVAVSTSNGPIDVVDVETGTKQRLLGHVQRVMDMAFSADGRFLLSGSFDKTIRVFAIDDDFSAPLGIFQAGEDVYSSLDVGHPVVSSRRFEPVELPANETLKAPALTPAAGSVAVRADWRFQDKIFLADGDTNKVLVCTRFACPEESITRTLVVDIVGNGASAQARGSADGRLLAVVDRDRALHVFDLQRPDNLPALSIHDERVRSAAFDASGERLFVLMGDELRVLPLGPNALTRVLEEKIEFCLPGDVRQAHFKEWPFVAEFKARRCRSMRGLP